MLKKIHQFILDTLFPVSCIICDQEGGWLCPKCLKTVPTLTQQHCPYCEKRDTPGGRACFSCAQKSSLSGLLVASSYKNKAVVRSIHNLKYNFVPDLAPFLGKLLAKAYISSDLPLPDLIIPIPLHQRRLRWRGFNQSALLALELAKCLAPGLSLALRTDIITRQRFTPPQMKIKSHFERQRNIEGAFKITKPAEVKNKTILLVDDVATTGATLLECARLLKSSGAKEIYATVLARQEYKK